jgi:hypothetical protein
VTDVKVTDLWVVVLFDTTEEGMAVADGVGNRTMGLGMERVWLSETATALATVTAVWCASQLGTPLCDQQAGSARVCR